VVDELKEPEVVPLFPLQLEPVRGVADELDRADRVEERADDEGWLRGIGRAVSSSTYK